MSRQSERHQFLAHDGQKLAAIIERPMDQALGVLLFSHCFTCSKDLKSIVRLSRKLVEHGWITCRFDFRGIGQSEGVFSETNFKTNLEDIESMVSGLHNIGAQVDFLFGHSFGGAASTLAAPVLNFTANANIKGVITLAAPSDTAHLADILLRKNPNIQTDGEGLVEIGGKSFAISRAMLDDFRDNEFSKHVTLARSKAMVPQMIIHSLSDETVSYVHALELFDLLRKTPAEIAFPDVSLYTLSDSDHLLSSRPQDLEHVASMVSDWCSARLR